MEARALILAAGAGTRMKSDKPKVLHELLGKPLVRWVVDTARAAGCDTVHAVIGHGREQVEPHLDDCAISYQLEMLGTGHTVMCAADALAGFSGTLLVLCGDTPLIRAETLRALMAAHERAGNAATVLTMHMDDPTGYGRIVRDADGAGARGDAGGEDDGGKDDGSFTTTGAGGIDSVGGSGSTPGNVARIVEEKDCDDAQRAIQECNSGIYCFDAAELLGRLDQLDRDNAQGEYYLTDMLEVLNRAGLKVGSMVVGDNDECLGINSRAQLAQATKVMQRRINAAHMVAGVTFTDPDLVWVGPDVQLARDVELLPLSFLMGATRVGAHSTIGPNTRLSDCTVGEGCSVEETVGIEAEIGDGCSVGPRAYLRQGTRLLEGAHVGTHVEVKKSTIGAGAKVPHLSYVGDATVGARSNLGAGTITCNYDGINKNPTTIGEDAFIGSSTMLVAPVSVGAGAIVGAASCITKDVPDGALALERNKQIVKEHWRERHEARHPGE